MTTMTVIVAAGALLLITGVLFSLYGSQQWGGTLIMLGAAIIVAAFAAWAWVWAIPL